VVSNRQIVDGAKDALFKAFKTWLDENQAEVLKIVADAVALRDHGHTKRELESEPAPNPHFLTAAQIADRWQSHPVSVLRLVRGGALSSVRFGRRVRVPLQEVERSEQQATLGRRRPDPL